MFVTQLQVTLPECTELSTNTKYEKIILQEKTQLRQMTNAKTFLWLLKQCHEVMQGLKDHDHTSADNLPPEAPKWEGAKTSCALNIPNSSTKVWPLFVPDCKQGHWMLTRSGDSAEDQQLSQHSDASWTKPSRARGSQESQQWKHSDDGQENIVSHFGKRAVFLSLFTWELV